MTKKEARVSGTKLNLRVRQPLHFWRPFITSVSVMLIVALNIIGLLSVGETAAYYWDTEISTGNFLGASRLDFVLESETEGGFRTQTIGGWGAKANGNNSASYRDANFTGAFPGGVTIGHPDGFTALFTTSLAIEKYLPVGGGAGSFNQNYVNPLNTSAGVLAAQTLALALSIGFDNYDPDFGSSPFFLSDWLIEGGPGVCNGMTPQEVLDESNLILAGLPASLTASEANSCTSFINIEFDNGVPYTISVKVSEVLEGIDWKYHVRSEKTGGSDDVCNAIDISVFLDDAPVYSGNLIGYISGSQLFTPLEDNWVFEIEMPSSVADGYCEFNFVFEGWQDNLLMYPFGFHDVETERFTVGSYPVVINEFLPNPIGDDDAVMPDGEWVELYNLSSVSIDVDGWYLYDNNASNSLEIQLSNSDNDGNTGDSGETIISAHGYLVVYLHGAYSDWLNNTGGDSVRLYNGPLIGAALVDSYAYTGTAPENKSYARIPDGTGDFVDPIPTPLKPNVTDEAIEDPLLLQKEGDEGVVTEPVLEESAVGELFVLEEVLGEEASVSEELLVGESVSGETTVTVSDEVLETVETIAEEMSIQFEQSSTTESSILDLSTPSTDGGQIGTTEEITTSEPTSESSDEPAIDFSEVITVNAPLPKETETSSETVVQEPSSPEPSTEPTDEVIAD